jgi:hypothetical protein
MLYHRPLCCAWCLLVLVLLTLLRLPLLLLRVQALPLVLNLPR